MEKIIFFALVIPIIGFVLYLGATAIMQGFNSKEENRREMEEGIDNNNLLTDRDKLSDELSKLSVLLQNKVITQDEFEKAKKKILGD
jgi:hypothetical protein